MQTITERYRETGYLCGVNMKQGSAMGDCKKRGVTRLSVGGLVSHWPVEHIGSASAINALALQNKMHCHCLPQGVSVKFWREIAAGRPGLITKVGLETLVDGHQAWWGQDEFDRHGRPCRVYRVQR